MQGAPAQPRLAGAPWRLRPYKPSADVLRWTIYFTTMVTVTVLVAWPEGVTFTLAV